MLYSTPFYFTLLFACANNGNHSNTCCRWRKDGAAVELDEKRHRLHSNGSVYINSVQRRGALTDEGVYQCLATLPDVGTIISRPARLDITYCECFSPLQLLKQERQTEMSATLATSPLGSFTTADACVDRSSCLQKNVHRSLQRNKERRR